MSKDSIAEKFYVAMSDEIDPLIDQYRKNHPTAYDEEIADVMALLQGDIKRKVTDALIGAEFCGSYAGFIIGFQYAAYILTHMEDDGKQLFDR